MTAVLASALCLLVSSSFTEQTLRTRACSLAPLASGRWPWGAAAESLVAVPPSRAAPHRRGAVRQPPHPRRGLCGVPSPFWGQHCRRVGIEPGHGHAAALGSRLCSSGTVKRRRIGGGRRFAAQQRGWCAFCALSPVAMFSRACSVWVGPGQPWQPPPWASFSRPRWRCLPRPAAMPAHCPYP